IASSDCPGASQHRNQDEMELLFTAEETSTSEKKTMPFENMVWIPGGNFMMGSDRHYPEEAPVHEASVAGFWMDRFCVTNTEFARFVEATSYITVAERP